MPAIRRPCVDVVLQVPKHQPYSEAKAKELEAAAAGASAPGPSSNGIPLVQISEPGVGTLRKQQDKLTSTALSTGDPTSGTNGVASDANVKAEDAEPELPMARSGETSSAEWNSLLIWARRMRGPQWDSGLGIWQVDRESQEYYTFCSDPKQSVHGPSRSAGEGDEAGQAADVPMTNGGPALLPSIFTSQSESSSLDSKYTPLASVPGASAFSPSMRPSTASPRQDPATAPSARPGSRNGPGPSSLSTSVETGSDTHPQRPGSRRGQQDAPVRPSSSRRRRPTMSSISGRSSSRRSSFSSGSSSPRSRSSSPEETPSSPPNNTAGSGGSWGGARPPQRTDANGIPGAHRRQPSFTQNAGFAGQQGNLGGGYPGMSGGGYGQ